MYGSTIMLENAVSESIYDIFVCQNDETVVSVTG